MLNIPLQKVKIDSCRILIPFELVNILDSTLEQNVVAQVFQDGHIEDLQNHQQKTTIHATHKGVKSRFAISHLFNEQGVQQKYLSVILNAKMLGFEYFQGINRNNINKVFEYINSFGVIEVKKEDFLYSKVVDVDLCFDVVLKNSTCSELVTTLYQLARPRKDVKIGTWKSKTNTGIQFGSREAVGKAYKTNQFLKYYAKMVSLKYDKNNIEFYETFIEPQIKEKTLFEDQQEYKEPFTDENLIRCETTIKNKAHFASYGLKIDTLKDLLLKEVQTDYFFFLRPQEAYITGFKPIQMKETETTNDKAYLMLMQMKAKEIGFTLEKDSFHVIDVLVNTLIPYEPQNKIKKSRSVLKSKLEAIAFDYKTKIAVTYNKKQKQMKLEFELKNLLPISS